MGGLPSDEGDSGGESGGAGIEVPAVRLKWTGVSERKDLRRVLSKASMSTERKSASVPSVRISLDKGGDSSRASNDQ